MLQPRQLQQSQIIYLQSLLSSNPLHEAPEPNFEVPHPLPAVSPAKSNELKLITGGVSASM